MREPYKVTITKPFYIGKYEVTQKQYLSIINNKGFASGSVYNPADYISWYEAKEFCDKLNKYAKNIPQGYKFDLPTEAQWEYACRAGTSTGLNNGKDIDTETGFCSILNEVAWYDKNSRGSTHPFGQKKPNAWGIYDMHGNVWEWCKDWGGDYPNEDVKDPIGANSGSYRIARGGGWRSYAKHCRSAFRYARDPILHDDDFGFRVALVPVQ